MNDRSYKVTESIISQYMDDAQQMWNVDLYRNNELIRSEPAFVHVGAANAYGNAWTTLGDEIFTW